MPVVDVACPGCGATLKAPDSLAGKKAQCKKCGVKFRIPGSAPAPAGDSADGQFLSTTEIPTQADAGVPAGNPFDFFAPAPAPEPPPAPKTPAAKTPEPPPKPAAAKPKAKPERKPAPPAEKAPAPPPEPPKAEDIPESAEPEPLPLDDEEEFPELSEPAKPVQPGNYHPTKKGGIGRLLLAVVVFGLVVGGVVGGVIVFLNQKKDTSTASGTKKEEPKGEPAAPAEPTPGKAEPKEPGATAKAGGTESSSPVPKSKGRPKGPAAPPGVLVIPPNQTVEFQAPAAKPEPIQEPTERAVVDPELPPRISDAFPAALRFFPPLKKDADLAVLWRTEAGFQGSGEKLTLALFSPVGGKPVNRVEVEGDGKEPVCDLSASGDLFAHAARGAVSVWNTRDGSKVVDGFDPYAGKPDHKAAGLAAVYLTEPPDTLVTVSTAGAVHAWKVPSKEPVGEYVPQKGAAGKVAAGRAVAPGPGRRSVVVAVGGSVYEVAVRPKVDGKLLTDLGGDVGQSLGLGASAGGRLVYLFETADGKREKGVMAVRPEGKHVVYRWPDAAGDPASAGWCGDAVAAVATARGGAVWFEAEGSIFRPIARATTPGDRALLVASDGQWALLPDPGDPRKCVMVEYAMPPQGLVDPLNLAAKRPVFTLRLDDKALHK